MTSNFQTLRPSIRWTNLLGSVNKSRPSLSTLSESRALRKFSNGFSTGKKPSPPESPKGELTEWSFWKGLDMWLPKKLKRPPDPPRGTKEEPSLPERCFTCPEGCGNGRTVYANNSNGPRCFLCGSCGAVWSNTELFYFGPHWHDYFV